MVVLLIEPHGPPLFGALSHRTTFPVCPDRFMVAPLELAQTVAEPLTEPPTVAGDIVIFPILEESAAHVPDLIILRYQVSVLIFVNEIVSVVDPSMDQLAPLSVDFSQFVVVPVLLGVTIFPLFPLIQTAPVPDKTPATLVGSMVNLAGLENITLQPSFWTTAR